MLTTLAASFLAIAAWLLLTGRESADSLSKPQQRKLFRLGVIGIVGIGGIALATIAARNVLHPPEWDMLIFWINGTAASHGMNFYDSALATHLARPFHPTPDFTSEALRAPFLYPPPSIVWFYPLGWFSLPAATLLWSLAQLLFLAASIFLLARSFFEKRSIANLLFTAALVLLLYSVYLNVKTEQTVFLLLLFLCLSFRHRFTYQGGIWLALAILVKPFTAALVLYFLCRRRWQALLASIASLALAALASFVILGRNVFMSYFAIDYSALPMSMYTELENQSLLAWTLRLTHATTRFSPAYIVLAAILLVFMLWRLISVSDQRDASAFALTLAFALVVYPASLRSYTVVLIFAVLLLRTSGTRTLLAIAYGLLGLFAGEFTILATLAIGIAVAIRMPEFVSDPSETG